MTRQAHILLAVVAFGLSASRPMPAQAQRGVNVKGMGGGIVGRVIDQQSRAPIGGASVSLIGTRLHTGTDSAGAFIEAGLTAGTYIVEVRADGYGVTSWVLRLGDGEVITYVFELTPVGAMGIELDPVTVEGRTGYSQRRLQEFQERRRGGRGVFYTEQQIRDTHAASLTDLLRAVPGVRLNCRSGLCTAQMTRGAHGICAADWVVDGSPASMSGTPHLPVVGIIGIEIYRNPSEVPAELLKADSQCGLIAIWTKSGP